MRRLMFFVLLYLVSAGIGGAAEVWERPDSTWSERDCNSIILASPWSSMKTIPQTNRFLSPTILFACWLSETMVNAFARIKQINERLTESEKIALIEGIKPAEIEGGIWFTIQSSGGNDLLMQRYKYPDETLMRRIFLQKAGDKNEFIRPMSASWSNEKSIIIGFENLKNGAVFIDSTDRRIELVLNLDSEYLFRFNIRDMIINGVPDL